MKIFSTVLAITANIIEYLYIYLTPYVEIVADRKSRELLKTWQRKMVDGTTDRSSLIRELFL